MTRLGWIILALILAGGASFWSMTSFGAADGRTDRATRSPPSRGEAATDGEALVVPVAGVARRALRSSWGDAREGGARAHHGLDVAAAAGTPVIAAAAGRIDKLFQSARGGITLYVRSPDGRWSYYYAHLARYVDGIREGMMVRAGDRLGYVGDTGDAGAGNYHLHFGMARMRAGDRWWQGEDVDPYPLLASGRPPS